MYPNLKLQLFRTSVRQNFLARQLGIDESILSKIIHGHRQPSEEQRKLLAGFLGSDESWLFEKYESPSNINSISHPEVPDGTNNDLS
jgi:transcriptional regulator with XRE-family HTH domain